MDSVSINQFHDRFQDYIDQVIDQHQPRKVTGHGGADFIVISAEDWEQAQETLYVLQNTDLMQQIVKSFATHAKRMSKKSLAVETATTRTKSVFTD